MLLLCSATLFEIEPTIRFLKDQQLQEVEVVITGVGLMAATYSITSALHRRRPRMMIQAGVAGSLDPQLPLTEVVVIRSETVGDLGVQEGGSFLDLFSMGLEQGQAPPFTNNKLVNPSPFLKEAGMRIVDGVTVNEISTSIPRMDHYRQQVGASVESLEGAALHYTGLRENIPFLQLRSISNFTGERNKEHWKLQASITTLNHSLQQWIVKLLNS